MSDERKGWKSCYLAIQQVLAKRGVESPFGQGDYWLVDEDYGGFDQKICVFRAGFLSRKVISEIQDVLAKEFPTWRVFIVLEIPVLLEREHEEGGIIIYAERVEEHWNRQEIETALGERLAI
jgi:hypothetical protein